MNTLSPAAFDRVRSTVFDQDEILAKFRDYAVPAISASRARALADAVRRLVETGSDLAPIVDRVCRT